MPKTQKLKTENRKAKTLIKKSPFKEKALLEKEIKDFANKYKTTVVNQAKRISDYFEMSCFNYVVRFYERKGYVVEVKNLQSGQYRYKCSTSGIQSNFSHFQVSISNKKIEYNYEIQHNLAAQSSQDDSLFTAPDISVITKGKVKYSKEYYDTKTTFSYVENKYLITFCEVKNFNPFPELLFNFTGILNELKKEYMYGKGQKLIPLHLAPSLMISGKPNKQTKRIKESLEKRYCINVIYDLFYTGTFTFSKGNINKLRFAEIKPSS